MALSCFDTLRDLEIDGRTVGRYHSLPALAQSLACSISRMPFSIRIVLESLVRNADGSTIEEADVRSLAGWQARASRDEEIPFVVARLVAPDASGIPFLADLAAMRDATQALGFPPRLIEPVVPVDLIVDHSLQVDRAGSADALIHNMQEEYRRNRERYSFLKWAAKAFRGFRITPPGVGIIHQVNIEQLARGVWQKDGIFFPDSLVGTDSHTSMINGIGVLGWGVGGIEAEAAMLGQPVYLLTPDVVGVELKGSLPPGATATDLVLTLTQTLRARKVVGKFVEFFGDGAACLPAPDRCTISNMAPEYGPTAAYFPVDDTTISFLRSAGRTEEELAQLRAYFEAQEMFGMPRAGQLDYTEVIQIDLASIVPSVAGPSRPQDRVPLSELKERVRDLIGTPSTAPSQASQAGRSVLPLPAETYRQGAPLRHGDVVLAAITSCSNTSNPGVLLAAGLLAKKAVEKGLRADPHVKTSFTPGSRVVNAYLQQAGLQSYLDRLGFQVAGYGCATCMGNSGPLDPHIEDEISAGNLTVAAVLSGNRNFEARIHQAIRANFLMSPPLVVAFAIAGRVDFDPENEPLGQGSDGAPVYLRDVWPSMEEIDAVMKFARDPENFKRLYADFTAGDELWQELVAPEGDLFEWDGASTYIRQPPFFEGVELEVPEIKPLHGARLLALLGDSVTTDHVSPASTIKPDSPAGGYLKEHRVPTGDFNSYIARRTNHEVMMRGTFGNVRLRNLMLPGIEGGFTLHQPDGDRMSIYDASLAYAREQVPLIVIAGEEYGTGSSRDWAAKGPALLGVRAVVARGYERIHRSNLIGMGILPCQFIGDNSASLLQLDGSETFDLIGLEHGVKPRQKLTLRITRADGTRTEVAVLCRIDTPVESDYFRHGGILPYMLRKLLREHEEVTA
jgi:aconitate hydratase